VPRPAARLNVRTLYTKHGLAVDKRRLCESITLTQETALLGYYVALSGNSLPTFRDNIGPIFKGQETIYYSLRNSPDERSTHLPRSLKSP
jgi:hypothetical protein